MTTEKIFLTAEEALSVLPDDEQIHCFLPAPFGVIGADWDREDVIDKIRLSSYREIAGPGAREMGHGLAVYNDAKNPESIHFFEAVEEKLALLEKSKSEPEGGSNE